MHLKKERNLSKNGMAQLAAIESYRERPSAISEEEIAKELEATGAVEYAEPDYLVYPAVQVPNDSKISSQWHHTTIKTFQAWETTAGRPEIKVTVCDSGVDAAHPDLKANVIQPGYNTVDGSTRSSPVNLHGTAVAGLIASQANNRIGGAGIAPWVKILPVRVSNSSSGSAYLSDLAECVRYGADQGAKVHNVSFTGAESPTIDSAAQYARSKGSILVMAAGNQGSDISKSTPDYTSFILVGATTRYDQRSSFSNYGISIDLVAPGTNVYTTVPNGGYTTISGTSFSSPITAAVAALVYSVNPRFTPADVEQILFQSADSLGNSYLYGRGRVNAEHAVELALRWVSPAR
jgi:subtilisin family serine protease